MILDVQSLGLQCFFGSGAVARYNCVAAVFPIMLLWPLGWTRHVRAAQIIADHCGPLQDFMVVSLSDILSFTALSNSANNLSIYERCSREIIVSIVEV